MKQNKKLNQTEPSPQQFPCTSCSQLSESILCLRCSHNLCLKCASNQLFRFAEERQIDPQILTAFKCNICGARTKIESNALQALIEMKQSKINDNSLSSFKKDKEISQFIPSASKLNRSLQQQQQQQQQYTASQFINLKQTSTKKQKKIPDSTNIYCKYHPDEISQLYCFTCQTECICVQCYLTGKHKAQNHDVRNIRSSEDNLFEVINQIQTEINEKIAKCLSEEEKIYKKKQSLEKEVSQINCFLEKGIDELKALLEEKLQFMLQCNDYFLKEKQEDLNQIHQQIENHRFTLNKYKSELNQCLESNEIENLIQSFNYYSQNKNQIGNDITIIEDELSNLLLPKINISINADFHSMQEYIANLKQIKLETIAISGLESLTLTKSEQQAYSKISEQMTQKKLHIHSEMSANKSISKYIQQSPFIKQKLNQYQDNQNSFDQRTDQLLDKLRHSQKKQIPTTTTQQYFNQQLAQGNVRDKLIYHQIPNQCTHFMTDLAQELKEFRKKFNQQ